MDGKQQELVKDNFELKDLCLYLDEERNSQVCGTNSEKLTIPSQESCIGDKLSCPHCGYGPIWVVSRFGENNIVNISLSSEMKESATEKGKNVSGNFRKR